MFHLLKASQVTLGDRDTPPVDDGQAVLDWLSTLYAYPDSADGGYLRANMIVTIDGAATYRDRSGGLGGDGDKTLFRVQRGLSDVVVVGARTALVEGYRQPAPDEAFAARRHAAGQESAPILALASRSLSIDPAYAPLTDPATLVLTCTSAPADRRSALADAGATVVDCGDDTVDPAAIVAECVRRGLPRILCEGGPRLLGSVAGADRLDELALTTSPSVLSGAAGRIATSSTDGPLRPMRPEVVLGDDDGFIFTRWMTR